MKNRKAGTEQHERRRGVPKKTLAEIARQVVWRKKRIVVGRLSIIKIEAAAKGGSVRLGDGGDGAGRLPPK